MTEPLKATIVRSSSVSARASARRSAAKVEEDDNDDDEADARSCSVSSRMSQRVKTQVAIMALERREMKDASDRSAVMSAAVGSTVDGCRVEKVRRAISRPRELSLYVTSDNPLRRTTVPAFTYPSIKESVSVSSAYASRNDGGTTPPNTPVRSMASTSASRQTSPR